MVKPIHRQTRTAAVLAIGALAGSYLHKRIRAKRDFAEYSYPSQFGTAEIFTLTSESGEPVRVLNVGGGFQSATYLGKKRFEPVFEYYRAFDHMFDCGNTINRVLMIGGGGFSYPKHLLTTREGVSIDVVEADPAIVDIARKHFFVDELEKKYGTGNGRRLNIWTGDGLKYLSDSSGKSYDAIINDAFDGANPAVSLLTSTALAKAKTNMTDDGLYLLNTVIAEDDNEMLRTYMEILLEGFCNVHAIKCVDEEFAGEDNWLLIASDSQHYFDGVEVMLTR